MWTYEKRLQYPVNITKTNAKMAKVIITQFGGPDGELAASQRYLSQRYSATNRKVAGVLTDIGTEEMAHFEMICAIVHQLTRNLTEEEIAKGGIDTDTVDLISANILNERNPTCYGTDRRWANHLYPVFLTESFVKSKYISTEMFLHLF